MDQNNSEMYPQAPQQYGAPPQQYGAPPQGAYPPPNYPPQYPPAGQPYGQPYSAPPPPGYNPQYGAPAYGAPVAYSPAPQTVVVATTTTHQKVSNGDHDVIPAVCIFVIGFFLCFVWVAGFAYIKSKNSLARVLSILSVIFFFLGLLVVVIVIPVVVVASIRAANTADCYINSYGDRIC